MTTGTTIARRLIAKTGTRRLDANQKALLEAYIEDQTNDATKGKASATMLDLTVLKLQAGQLTCKL